MATTPKTTIGTMACLCCGQEIPVRRSENNTLNVPCQWCQFPAYAKAGTDSHAIIMGKTKLNAAPALESKAPPATKTIAQQAVTVPMVKRQRNSIFDLGGSAT